MKLFMGFNTLNAFLCEKQNNHRFNIRMGCRLNLHGIIQDQVKARNF